METKHISIEEIYHKLISIEKALRAKGIISDNEDYDDEGELTDEFKKELEKRRRTPDSEYISFEEVKKQLKKKRGVTH